MTAADVRPTDPFDTALDWFEQLYRDVDRGWCNIFSIDQAGERHVDWFPHTHVDELAVAAIDRSADSNVWFGVATRYEQLDGNRRGGDTDCDQISALWVDIDVAGPNHADNTNLPANFDDAWRLAHTFPQVATTIVNTGGGLQAWWLLNEPVDADTAVPLLARWEATWKHKAAEQHLHIDSVFDLARVMRVPGTTNRKTIPTPVVILDADWDRRYGADDLDQWLIEPPAPTGDPAVPRHDYIGPERPGDAFNVRHSGAEILAELGFTFARRDRNSDEHWVRPGKDKREGTSATIYGEDGHVTIWSDTAAAMWPALVVRRPYDPYGLLVATRYHGDFARASSELRARGYGTPHNDLAQQIVGNTATVDHDPVKQPERPRTLPLRWLPDTFSKPPLQPATLVTGLLRAGELCAMAAPRAIGKSWFAMNLAVLLGQGEGKIAGKLEIVRPTKVLYAHGELDEYSAYERWLRMCGPDGAPSNVAESFERWRLRIINRRTSSTTNGISSSDEHIDALIDQRLEATIVEHDIEVLVIDPWAVFYAGKENSNDETEAALDKLRDLSLRYGLAVVIVHHISAKTQPGHLAEPEDLWRGATRLADWASTRVTILRHFTNEEAAERQLTRQEARRFVDVKILRRGEPTPDFSMRMNFSTGWWQQWDDDSQIIEPKLTPESVADRCRQEGGFESKNQAAAYHDVHHTIIKPLLDRAVVLGLLRTERGIRNATRYLPIDRTQEAF